MNSVTTQAQGATPAQLSLEMGQPPSLADEARYCPTRLLSAFALLMAGHGRPVCTAMMLGDREYAMLHLARAHTMHDPQLREIAARLFAYFQDERAPAPLSIRA
jgi:hypothetical protein